ncbi:MAG: SIS domain-containing protein [Trueperaceae bacterium]|nr:SIS domain-containing protein [Trueperaceae bacterium]
MIAAHHDALQAIEEAYPSLSPAGRRVADRVLREPDSVPRTTLAALARDCGVSEPTVIRFCRAVGCDGFADFKVRLAASIPARFASVELSLTPDSSAAEYAAKVVDASLAALMRLRSGLAPEQVETAVDALAGARRIEFYGVGASGVVALDAQHKFFRLSTPTTAHRDTHMQRMAAAVLGPGDVAVAFSNTGRSRVLIESMTLARRSGATTLAITASASHLAQACDLHVDVDSAEDTDVFTPMVSRLAHLVVVDVLALGVALRGNEQNATRLKRIKEALAAERLPPARSRS